MSTSKDYAVEQNLGSTPADLSGPNASGDFVSGGYPSADFYITGFSTGASYDLYAQEDGVEAPTAAQQRGSIGSFQAATGVVGRLIARGVPLVASQKFYINSTGSGPVNLFVRRYTWGDNVA